MIIIIAPKENHLLRALENRISLQKLKHICILLILCEESEDMNWMAETEAEKVVERACQFPSHRHLNPMMPRHATCPLNATLKFSCHSNCDPLSIMKREGGRKIKNKVLNYTICTVIVCNCYNSQAPNSPVINYTPKKPYVVYSYTVPSLFWGNLHSLGWQEVSTSCSKQDWLWDLGSRSWLHLVEASRTNSTASLRNWFVPELEFSYPLLFPPFNLRFLSQHSDEHDSSFLITFSQVLGGCYFAPYKLFPSG